ncbi:MAG: DNA methyltransferase [Candidatus Gracilibacteria bacterium]|nr:DNA methyltransferase [Candidatus Gracilibacteria bacterium]
MKAEKQSVYIRKIKDLEDELKKLKKSKRYGLVWEDKLEDVVERCRTELPVLIGDETKSINENPNGPTNILIEGDNYHALSVLAYTHEKKVDVIYIDPPYNTGSRDWKYNNDYVDNNDTFRHSKWLCMMNKRLLLAKKLLKETGVLICTIDENEHATLGLLLREIFTDYDIDSIVIVHNPAGVQGKNFSYTHEFAYFVYPSGTKSIGSTIREKDLVSPLRDWGGTSARKLAKTCFYPIIIKDSQIIGVGDVCDIEFHPQSGNIIKSNGEIYIYPIDSHGIERKWVFSRNSVQENLNQLFVKEIDGEYVIMRRKSEFTYRTVWDDKKYYANIYGSKLLSKIISDKFPFPKSLYAVEDCIKAVIHNKENAVILDFFAGSGTTGHAVLELNKEDGGNRQFILCTNNENKIAEEVTYPRIHNVIQGYGDVPGIPANLRYYRTDFIGMEKSIDDLRKKFMGRCTEMLQIRESCFNRLQVENENEYFQVFESKEAILAVLYHPYEIIKLQKLADTTTKPIVAYIFSMGMEIFQEELAHFSNRLRIETIPDEILETYKKIFGF